MIHRRKEINTIVGLSKWPVSKGSIMPNMNERQMNSVKKLFYYFLIPYTSDQNTVSIYFDFQSWYLGYLPQYLQFDKSALLLRLFYATIGLCR